MRIKIHIGILLILGFLYLLTNQTILLADENQTSDTLKQKAVLETIRTRRTVREFKATPVPKEDIVKILDAARYAPTSGNVQPWKFVIIQDRNRLDLLCQVLQDAWKQRVANMPELNDDKRKLYVEHGKKAIQRIMTAPIYVIVFVDTSAYPQDAVWDGCLAAGNLMLAARAMGYGTGFFTSYFPEETIKSFVKAPESLKFICATPIGIPKQWPQIPPKKDLNEFIIYENFEEK